MLTLFNFSKLQNPQKIPMSQQQLSPETLESIFFQLKPYCIELLNLMNTPKKSAPFLLDMVELLRQAPPHALQPSLDYTMFPLLLLLDAAVKCRVGVKADDLMGGFEISDSVAEGLLLCIEELLIKCHLGSVNQMVVVLKKLNAGAMLTPDEASEKFREAVLRCLRAMLFRIKPCSKSSCTCKDITSLAIINSLEEEYSTCMKFDTEPQECLLAFFRSQDAAAAIGHWMSLLLQIAETEVARGHRGSSSLCKEALLTIRVLIAKIGTADALAFFLPGIVSRFSKALHLTKNMISGAAGSSSCIEHTLYGLSEFLMIVLNDKANHSALESSMEISEVESAQSILQALRSLPTHKDEKSEAISTYKMHSNVPYDKTKSLYVARTKEWIDKTSENVDKLLSATFPHLAIHPSEKVRKRLVESTRGLLTNCCCTLRRSKLMLLECLCVLICDDSTLISVAAHQSVKSLFMLGEKFLNQDEISVLFSRLIEGLPRAVFGNEETTAISHARKLLALMYYAGPELVVEHLLSSSIKSSRFLEFLMLSLSHNSQFMGPVDKLILSKPLSVGYLLSVAELKAGTLTSNRNYSNGSITQPVYEMSNVNNKNTQMFVDIMESEYELPRMPPWFINIGSEKLYFAIAGILRLSGLSVMAGRRSSVSLSVLVDILLESFHKLISELRIRDYKKEGWQEWYTQRGSGQLLRQTSSAICILNEIVYGLSDQSVCLYSQLFACSDSECNGFSLDTIAWKVRGGKEARDQIIYCIGSILHEYLSLEVWELPEDQTSPSLQNGTEVQPSLHFFRDTTMLHQVIIEGIGILSMVLGKDFERNGFMHSTLCLLLQKLICSNSQIKIASDAVLRMLSTSSGYPSVGHLVVANADYIIDSLCRQLRHIDVNPQTPDVIAAMLSYVGTANEILPLLEEPMRAVSSELEVLGRHQHPHLTFPFLKAVSEIAKASRSESSKLPCKAESFSVHVDAEVSIIHETGSCSATNFEQLEELLLKLNEMRRYRRIVASLALSCLKTAVPFLSSLKESSCLLALNIIEDVTLSIAKVEEAYKHEKKTKISIEKAQLSSFSDLQDSMDSVDDEADENRLLPAMNTVWPYLILCIKNKVSVAVITKCTNVISNAVQTSGGDFFIRRFHTDGPTVWKLLSTSPFQRKPTTSKYQKQIILPYRNTQSTENSMAEMSSLKIQISILNMIAELSSNKKSASAIAGVIKKVSGLVVGIACSSVIGLRDSSINALHGLACIDSDLIWLLTADVYYSVKSKERIHPQPPALDLPELSRILPKPASAKDYLHVQYGGQSSGFDLDVSAVEVVFQKVQSWQFT